MHTVAKQTQRKILTLCLVHNHPHVLLGLKKRGFGAGLWNGFGGKVEEGEAVCEAAKREVFEEAGIALEDILQVGVLDFSWAGKPEVLEVNVFRGAGFSGEPCESEEMRPQWFHVDKIPFDVMWPDDEHWFPLFLSGKKFRGAFLFDAEDTILKKELREVPEL